MQLAISYKTKTGHDRTTRTTPYVLICWEREYKRTADEGFRFEDLAFLAWESVRQAGDTVPPFDTWAADLVDLELVTGDDESRPTRPGVSDG